MNRFNQQPRLQDVLNAIIYEPADEITARELQAWLSSLYPEARWQITVRNNRLDIGCEFDTPEQKTFYMLKWS